YLVLKETGAKLSLPELQSVFERKFYNSLELVDVPILYKKEMSDNSSAIKLGKNMLGIFHEEVDLDGAIQLKLSNCHSPHNYTTKTASRWIYS
ncbi:MAG: hypothetical protein P4L69_19025, partial [Desulfosporosinus sp.]|nr:hypothetical protein [Desulfosporosinus sp.]